YVYTFLIVHEPFQHAEVVLIADGATGFFDVAAQLYQAGQVRRIAIVNSDCHRAIRMGILPGLAETARDELVARGVPSEIIAVIPASGFTFPENLPNIHDWMLEQDVERIVILCPECRGRQARFAINSLLPERSASRTIVYSVPQERFDVRRWWLSRSGLRTVFDAYFRLGFSYCGGLRGLQSPDDPN
ncbi:MAG: hypothetical protein HYV60_12615, partial [Planctomycetia bacterium]|nr:hypothetical protein [Planctomycetia bacterium]